MSGSRSSSSSYCANVDASPCPGFGFGFGCALFAAGDCGCVFVEGCGCDDEADFVCGVQGLAEGRGHDHLQLVQGQ